MHGRDLYGSVWRAAPLCPPLLPNISHRQWHGEVGSGTSEHELWEGAWIWAAKPNLPSPLQSSTKSGVGLQVSRYVLCLGHSAQGSDCILAGGSGSEARTLCDWLLSLVWPSTFWTLCEA